MAEVNTQKTEPENEPNRRNLTAQDQVEDDLNDNDYVIFSQEGKLIGLINSSEEIKNL